MNLRNILNFERNENDPPCKECLVQGMCIKEIDNGHNITIRVCEKLYEHLLMGNKNLNKGENNAILH